MTLTELQTIREMLTRVFARGDLEDTLIDLIDTIDREIDKIKKGQNGR